MTSIQQLENDIHAKEHELNSIGSAISSAGIGAALIKDAPLAGALAGAFLGSEKNKKAALERELADLKQQLQNTHSQISQLETKKSELMNTFQNQKAQFKADMRQKRNDLERKRQDEQNPEIIRLLDEQLSRFQSKVNAQEVTQEQTHEKELYALQQEIDKLTF